jgi:hypothetical protein
VDGLLVFGWLSAIKVEHIRAFAGAGDPLMPARSEVSSRSSNNTFTGARRAASRRIINDHIASKSTGMNVSSQVAFGRPSKDRLTRSGGYPVRHSKSVIAHTWRSGAFIWEFGQSGDFNFYSSH